MAQNKDILCTRPQTCRVFYERSIKSGAAIRDKKVNYNISVVVWCDMIHEYYFSFSKHRVFKCAITNVTSHMPLPSFFILKKTWKCDTLHLNFFFFFSLAH
jgi:hypothetical protein